MIQTCDECVVCFDKKDLVLFKECGHQICCADCVVNLFQKNSSSSCPFCRKLISNPRNQCISYHDVVKIIRRSDIHKSVKNQDETKYVCGYFYRRIKTASQAGRCQVFVPFEKNNVVADFLTRGQFRYVFHDDARGYQIEW